MPQDQAPGAPGDPALSRLTDAELARLGREYLLAGHLVDRASMPQVLARLGETGMTEVAIDQWRGASPIYTRRMQRALGFVGDDVPTIFKGLQLDVGAPHQFMDFRYRVHDDQHGEFWLDHCGALMDVEPMGESMVRGMCHDIEDPTFDATAAATNPRARMRPIHRPPREPADREPHCRWRVFIDPDADPVGTSRLCDRVAGSRAARLPLHRPQGTGAGDGRADYAGPFEPDFQLEHLARPALVAALHEICLQAHLLVHALLLTLTERLDRPAAREIGRAQLRGVAPVVAGRLRDALEPGTGHGDDAAAATDALAWILRLHPALRPHAYVATTIERREGRVRLALDRCPALEENGDASWAGLLAEDPSLVGDLARGIDARTRCEAVAPAAGEVAAWELTVDPAAEPGPTPDEVALTRASTGTDFALHDPLPTVD